ncbi:hypothetical protein Tdes44962_MAKER03556 [Teratosphaeria destructans]|uniref:Uncharacterized protein n=1 Tax=Teratosphaeria destructans TaxID=418781 RepID=A0A9W7W161_9PEZI|nr:hypothetical protein Tdes44962_MAKER03556 [Teratosphaeria destructans]
MHQHVAKERSTKACSLFGSVTIDQAKKKTLRRVVTNADRLICRRKISRSPLVMLSAETQEDLRTSMSDQKSPNTAETEAESGGQNDGSYQDGRKPRLKTPDLEDRREWDTIQDTDDELDIEDAPYSKLHQKSLRKENEFLDARKAEGGLIGGEGDPEGVCKDEGRDVDDDFERLDKEVKEMRSELNRELYDEDDGGVKEGE